MEEEKIFSQASFRGGGGGGGGGFGSLGKLGQQPHKKVDFDFFFFCRVRSTVGALLTDESFSLSFSLSFLWASK